MVSAELSNDLKETVRSQTDIVALIGESVALQARHGGREFVGLCPFHDDHDPSMRVYPDRQSYRCWVCNTGGDCFTFVMEREKVEFRDALEILARRANIPIPPKGRRGPAGASGDEKSRLYEALVWAQNLFHKTLLEDPIAEPARRYLRDQRGFTDETIRKFRLGYHPNDWEWLLRQAQGKYSPKQLLAARLVGERRDQSGYFDHFVDRVLFPICNERSQPVGFGGRILPGADDSHGKYWNSPESPVFHKSRLVYGLNFAREAIIKSETAIVTEGYTDCIAAHQQGVENVVGTLGTALTDQHVTTVKRFARKVVLVYDGDAAGQRAADRAVEIFLAQDVDLRILTLPHDVDPADFLGQQGPEAFRRLAAEAPEAWEFKYGMVRHRHGGDTIDGRHRILEEMLGLLVAVPRMAQNVREGLLLANLAQRLRLGEQEVRDRYKQLRSNPQHKRRPRIDEEDQPTQVSAGVQRLLSGRLSRDEMLECDLLEIIVAAPQLLPLIREEVRVEMLRCEPLRRLLESFYAALNEQATPAFDRLLAALENGDLKRLAVWIDDRARAKEVEKHLRDSTAEAVSGCPLFLRRSIENLKWRREEQTEQQRIAVQLSTPSDGSPPPADDAEGMLRQAHQFHQRRATKKASV